MQQIEKALNRDCKQLVGYLYLDLHHSLLCLDLQLLQIRYQLVRQEAFLKVTHQEDLAHLVVCWQKLVQLLNLGVPQTLLINYHLDSTPAIQLIILLVQILLNKNLLEVLTHQEDLAHLVVCLAKLVQLLLDLGVPQTLLINHHLDSTPAIQLIILLVQILLNKNLLEVTGKTDELLKPTSP
ncbi:uncharacterized protein LOC142327948 isoform X2 [Lycorma delicatula]|uniref:uncharacterized protein LOC142327948 isoform X2 n=1 Tax=Lycorma delicatula TaxID=130591 RepID=UPI003F510071